MYPLTVSEKSIILLLYIALHLVPKQTNPMIPNDNNDFNTIPICLNNDLNIIYDVVGKENFEELVKQMAEALLEEKKRLLEDYIIDNEEKSKINKPHYWLIFLYSLGVIPIFFLNTVEK